MCFHVFILFLFLSRAVILYYSHISWLCRGCCCGCRVLWCDLCVWVVWCVSGVSVIGCAFALFVVSWGGVVPVWVNGTVISTYVCSVGLVGTGDGESVGFFIG